MHDTRVLDKIILSFDFQTQPFNKFLLITDNMPALYPTQGMQASKMA